MAIDYKNVNPVSFIAGGAIPANSAVKLSAANTVVVTTAITENVIGFARTTAASGDVVTVETASGVIVKAILGGTVSLGAELMPKASGAGVLDTAAGSTAVSCAIALAAGASGETVPVLTRFAGKGPANS
jgi:hypothetical protein